MKKQCTKCNGWIWVTATEFDGKIPQHTCVDDKPCYNVLNGLVETITDTSVYIYDSNDNNNSNTATSSDIGGGGDFGGGGASGDY